MWFQTLRLTALAQAHLDPLPESERLALWINAYNAYTIELINRHGGGCGPPEPHLRLVQGGFPRGYRRIGRIHSPVPSLRACQRAPPKWAFPGGVHRL